MTAKFFMKLPDCFHRKAQVPARDEIRQNATPLVEGLHKKAELQFKVRNMQPTLLNFKRLQFSARHSASYQAALTIFSGTFAEHCIGRANENMREADELHGYVASFDYIIPLTRSGFASNVEEAASCVRNALECYLHCSGEVKEKLKPRISETVLDLVDLLVFADKALGKFDGERKQYILRDSTGRFFKEAHRFAERISSIGLGEESQRLHRRIYEQYFSNNPYLSKELEVKLRVDACAGPVGEEYRKGQLEVLEKKFGIKL